MEDGKVPMSWAIKAKIIHGMIHTLTLIIRAREITQTSSGGSLNNLNNKEDVDSHLPGSIKSHSYHHNFQHNLSNQIQGLQNQAKEMGEVKKQIGQMAEFMGQFREEGKLPSSTIINPKEGFETAKAITLRSGKEIGPQPNMSTSSQKGDEKLLLEDDEVDKATAKVEQTMPQPFKASKLSLSGKVVPNSTHSNLIPPNVPFPRRFMQSKNEENEKDILETFRKVQVNIPLLDAIKQVPRYAKFLKELCTTRRRILNKEVVQVNNLIFPTDFYVLEMEDLAHSTPLLILLGRPFMKTARTKIDVFKGTLTMEFDGEIIDFHISKTIRYPKDDHSCLSIDVFDSLAHDYLDSLNEDALETTIAQGIGLKCNMAEPIPAANAKMAPIIELKPLPDHLKYVFLGDKEILPPVIVSSSLMAMEEEKLIRVLKEHKTAIGWTLADIKGISPTTCMHHILLEEGAKPTQEVTQPSNDGRCEKEDYQAS
ncbi:uncharacterized protein [Malus domestica]|uniref:uncharacterized protein n=1 Tax=Malus domestica TaxID=3750 RepID=UPI003976370D